MTAPAPDLLDQVTIALVFALRDSLTDDGPSRLDFWSGRAATALAAAAAGAEDAGEAVTTAARKLQIPVIAPRAAQAVASAVKVIDADYAAWARHVDRHVVSILALADVQRQQRRAAQTKAAKDREDPTF